MKDLLKLLNKNLKYLNKTQDRYFYKHFNLLNLFLNLNNIKHFQLKMMLLLDIFVQSYKNVEKIIYQVA